MNAPGKWAALHDEWAAAARRSFTWFVAPRAVSASTLPRPRPALFRMRPMSTGRRRLMTSCAAAAMLPGVSPAISRNRPCGARSNIRSGTARF